VVASAPIAAHWLGCWPAVLEASSVLLIVPCWNSPALARTATTMARNHIAVRACAVRAYTPGGDGAWCRGRLCDLVIRTLGAGTVSRASRLPAQTHFNRSPAVTSEASSHSARSLLSNARFLLPHAKMPGNVGSWPHGRLPAARGAE